MRRSIAVFLALVWLLGIDSPVSQVGAKSNFEMRESKMSLDAEGQADYDLLQELLVKVEIEGQTYPVGQPSLGRYKSEDYGWDPEFFIACLMALGQEDVAMQMLDGNALKIKLAGYLPLVTRWDTSQHDAIWKIRTKDDPRFSAETQQPLIAQTALTLYRTLGPERVPSDRLRRWTEAAQTHLDWLSANRRGPGRQLFWILDPIESGEDSLTVWDQISAEKGSGLLPRGLRVFQISPQLNWQYYRQGWDLEKIYGSSRSVIIEPVSLNILATRELLALEVLWKELGDKAKEVENRIAATALIKAIDQQLWNSSVQAYFPQARFGRNDWRQLTVYSVESLYPLLLPDLDPDRATKLIDLMNNTFGKGVHYLLPVQPTNPEHPTKVWGQVPIWQPGQVWANTNWFFRDALNYQSTRLGSELARSLSERVDADWKMLKQTSGYPEFYFQDGTGGAEKRFFWSCLRKAKFSVEIK